VILFAACLAVLLLGALGALLPRSGRAAGNLGAGAAVLGSLLGLAAAAQSLAEPTGWALAVSWPPPWGLGRFAMDELSAFFLIPAFLLCGLGAVYGRGYLAHLDEQGRRAGPPWCLYNLLTAAIAGVFTARAPFLFLLCWELMALTSYFLVCQEHEDGAVRRAGRVYLIASHLGAAFLLVLFLMPGATWPPSDATGIVAGAAPAGLAFCLALVGFGSKAGLAPLSVWLPEAHPAAPSHVSAVLSGVMIKTGVYGILRLLLALDPAPWWGWALIGLGGATAVIGVAGALCQGELKRLLAWSSMENAGLLLLALGLGALGRASGAPVVAALGFGAALIHVVSHGVFKSLLFFCAGSVLHATGERRMDRLGGLMRRMPATGAAFFIGAAGISGLPPLGCFATELVLGLAALKALLLPTPGLDVPGLTTLAVLALCAGMAAAAFAGARGVVFLGEPRGEAAGAAHEAPAAMRWPMLLLSGLGLLLGLGAPLLLNLALLALRPALPEAVELAAPALTALTWSSAGFGLLLALLAGLAGLRRWLLSGRDVRTGPTWDCGYAAPTARIQYTYTSFAQPLADMFQALTGPRGATTRAHGLFPSRVGYAAEARDRFLAGFLALFRFADSRLEALHRLQQGQVHVYVLYIAATLVGLLAWGLK